MVIDMPQPLRSVKRNARVFITADAISSNIKLATLVASVINYHARLEVELAVIFTHILGTSAPVGYQMYNSIESAAARSAILKASAQYSLNEEDNELFLVLHALFMRAAKKRHRLAHWVFGYSPDIPDALLLIEPEHLAEVHSNINQYDAKATSPSIIDTQKVFVYRQNDFREMCEQANQLEYFLSLFTLVVKRFPQLGDAPRATLLDTPQIREELKRRRERHLKKTHPSTPEQ